jgi:hypothetical protein
MSGSRRNRSVEPPSRQLTESRSATARPARVGDTWRLDDMAVHRPRHPPIALPHVPSAIALRRIVLNRVHTEFH